MSRTSKAALLLLFLCSIPLGLVLFNPGFVLGTLLDSSASRLGYQIDSMRVSQLGLRSLTLEQLSLNGEQMQLSLRDMRVQYSLSGLLDARLESVEIGETVIRRLATAEQPDSEEETTISYLLQAFDDIPVDSLDLQRLVVHDEGNALAAELSLQSPPLRLQGSARLNTRDDIELEFALQRRAESALAATASVYIRDALAVETTMSLNAAGSDLSVTASSTILMNPLRQALRELAPATAFAIGNDRLSLDGSFEAHDLFGEPSLSDIRLALNSPEAGLDLSQQSDLGSSDMQLQLPLSLRGEVGSLDGELQLTFGELYSRGSWARAEQLLQVQSRFTNTRLHCQSFSSCDLDSDWQGELVQWSLGEYSGANLSVTAALQFDYANDEMHLVSDLARLEVPSLQVASDVSGLQFATSLQVEELELRVGEIISGGFSFRSDELRLDNDIVAIERPAYSGRLQLEDDVVTGILELDLDQRLRLGFGLQHYLLRDTGDVVIQLAAHEFTDAEPLSSLLAPLQLEMDLVAGRVEGLANVSWSKQQDGSWRFGGPVAVKLEQLSGYYDDYFFVELGTDLFGEVTTPLGLQVANPASASLSRIDIGLPLENLALQYRFDTQQGTLQLNDFSTELLGGRLSIPELRYNRARDRQQVDVVLADLSVEALVALAAYPGVYADGLISGYLPFIVEGDTLTIEKGLVGALKPGGSIRYTPANAAPSSNPSIRLVNEALANYQYQTMNTEVFYDPLGELLLQVQLHGRNPDMNNGQEINLNLNISDNIPALLQSLQASRVISDELERYVQAR